MATSFKMTSMNSIDEQFTSVKRLKPTRVVTCIDEPPRVYLFSYHENVQEIWYNRKDLLMFRKRDKNIIKRYANNQARTTESHDELHKFKIIDIRS